MNGRLVAGFVSLPFLAAVLGFAVLPLAWQLTNPRDSILENPGQVAIAGATLCGAVGTVMTLVAIPVVAWLRRRKRLDFGDFVWAGVALGNAPLVLWVVFLVIPATVAHAIGGTLSNHLLTTAELISGVVRVVLLGTILGATLAAAFWTLAIRNAAR